MKLSNENKVLIGVGILGAGVLGYLAYDKNQKEKEQLELAGDIEPAPVVTSPKTTSNPAPVAGATLNKNLLLKKGSKGLEVRELQRLLGVTIDGDFGNNTLSALQKAKGVTEISINNFLIKKPAPKKPAPKKAAPTALVIPKVGSKLMAIKDGVTISTAKQIANGSYTNTRDNPFLFTSYNYGDEIGTFVAANVKGKFLIKRNTFYYFVDGASVKPY